MAEDGWQDPVWPWLVLLVVMCLWMLGAYNRLMAMRAAIVSAWAPVDSALSSRGQALAAILAAAAEPLADERPALDAVASALAQVLAAQELLRKRPVAQATVADLAKADAVLTAVNQRLLALVEQHALLRQQPEVQAALALLQTQGPQLQFARQTFNEAGLRYNQAMAEFPTRLLVPVFRFDAAGKF